MELCRNLICPRYYLFKTHIFSSVLPKGVTRVICLLLMVTVRTNTTSWVSVHCHIRNTDVAEQLVWPYSTSCYLLAMALLGFFRNASLLQTWSTFGENTRSSEVVTARQLISSEDIHLWNGMSICYTFACRKITILTK